MDCKSGKVLKLTYIPMEHGSQIWKTKALLTINQPCSSNTKDNKIRCDGDDDDDDDDNDISITAKIKGNLNYENAI